MNFCFADIDENIEANRTSNLKKLGKIFIN